MKGSILGTRPTARHSILISCLGKILMHRDFAKTGELFLGILPAVQKVYRMFGPPIAQDAKQRLRIARTRVRLPNMLEQQSAQVPKAGSRTISRSMPKTAATVKQAG
jgi:hypothetical protein